MKNAATTVTVNLGTRINQAIAALLQLRLTAIFTGGDILRFRRLARKLGATGAVFEKILDCGLKRANRPKRKPSTQLPRNPRWSRTRQSPKR